VTCGDVAQGRADRLAERSAAAIALVAGALLVLLLLELGLRVPLPCDLYIWAESPFMTNLLKLWNGAPIYGDPTNVNSFIYAPGLEYITWAVLAPFGLALDIRFCRLVNVLIGLGAAATMAVISLRVADDLARVEGRRSIRRARLLVAAFSIGALVVFSNFTSFAPHPDNLQMLHAALTLFLCHAALRTGSVARAVAAMAFAALGCLTKQTAAFTWAGALTALVVAGPWRWRTASLLAATGAVVFACAALPLVIDPHARFFTIRLPLLQGITWSKWIGLFQEMFSGHRLLLVTIAPACALRIAGSGRRGRDFVVAWTALLCTAALSNVVSYMKTEGADNNFGIVGFWLLPLALANLPGLAEPLPTRASSWFLAMRLAAFGLLLVSVVPLWTPLPASARTYCSTLVDAVGNDLRAGRRVLLAHGTTPLIWNGARDVPLDRGNTVLEYTFGGRLDLTRKMTDRIEARYYDRIYVNSRWYFWQMSLIEKHYREVQRIPHAEVRTPFAAAATPTATFILSEMMLDVVVYEPR
jgi:hypothetical protein